MHILLQQFLILLFLAVIFYFLPVKEKKKELFFMIVAFIPMWYIHSMVKVGTVPDTANYEKIFYQVQFMSWKQCIQYEGAMEGGYLILNKVITLFTKDYYVFQGLYGLVLLLLYFWSFRKYSPYAILSILILLAGTYNISIYVIRQYLAVAIFVASIPLILERKLYLYLLVCVLNFFVHKTSLICLPVYFIFQMKPYLIFITTAVLALVIFAGSDMIAVMSIESLEDYQTYLVGDQGGQSWVAAAISGFELGVFVLFMREKIWKEDIVKLLMILLVLVFFVNIATIGKAGTVSRLASYYGVASLFALPYILKEIKQLPLKVAVLFGIMFIKVYPAFFGSSGLKDLIDMQFIR